MKLHPGRFVTPTVFCLLLASCAQTGPPLPPSLELPKPPADLRASRKGSHLTLSWSEPTITTDRQSVRYLGATLVCRSLEPEITTCGNPAAILPAPSSVSAAPQKSGLPRPAAETYTDTLPPALQQEDPSAEVTYAVEALNRNARGAGLSNRVRVSAVRTANHTPLAFNIVIESIGATKAQAKTRLQAKSPWANLVQRISRTQPSNGKRPTSTGSPP